MSTARVPTYRRKPNDIPNTVATSINEINIPLNWIDYNDIDESKLVKQSNENIVGNIPEQR